MDNILVKKTEYQIVPIGYNTFVCSAGANIPYTRSNQYVVHFIFTGSGVFYSPRGNFTVSAGQIFIIRPFEMTRYASDNSNPLVISSISFDIVGIKSIKHISFLEFLSTDVFTSYESQLLFEKVRALKEPSINDYIYLSSVLHELFWNINKIKDNKLNASYRDYVDIGLEFIHNNYKNKISISGISSFLGIDSRYFSSLFSKKLGISPQKYIINFRLEKATDLLSNGFSITNTAQSCGYFDLFNFSKMFKKKYGITPTEYATLNNHKAE